MDQYRAALHQARAALAAANSREQDRVIRAPFAGRLGMTDIAPGTLISPGATVVTLDDTTTMRVDFDVPDRFLPALKVGAPIVARPDPYPDQTIQGHVALVDSRIDPNTHAIRARAEFANPNNLLVPGMLMHMPSRTVSAPPSLCRRSAVQTEGDQTYVYVIAHQDGKTIARQTEVDVGVNEGGFIEIRDGLTAGAQVIADGLSRVEPNATVRVVGAHRVKPRTADTARNRAVRPKLLAQDGLRATSAMMLSDLSVRRPVFAAVAAIILCVIGLAAFFALPVRELPSVDPPVVSITTTYLGASAEVIEERITQVIERRSPASRASTASTRPRATAPRGSPSASRWTAISTRPPTTCATRSRAC